MEPVSVRLENNTTYKLHLVGHYERIAQWSPISPSIVGTRDPKGARLSRRSGAVLPEEGGALDGHEAQDGGEDTVPGGAVWKGGGARGHGFRCRWCRRIFDW